MRKNYIKIIIIINFITFIFVSKAYAVSPAVSPKPSITATPTLSKKVSTTPTASPSGTLTPASPDGGQGGTTPAEDEKVQEIRQAIKDKLNEIKDKIEKKAYVGIVTEITDSTLTLSNFRGKQRVRVYEETSIIAANKKEASIKDLAVDDKVIALGEPDTNETLDTKRIIVITPLKTVPAKRLIFYGTVKTVDTKTSTITLTGIKNPSEEISLKIDKTTILNDQKDPKANLALKNFTEGQKVIAVYPEANGSEPSPKPTGAKTIIAKTLFLLPQ